MGPSHILVLPAPSCPAPSRIGGVGCLGAAPPPCTWAERRGRVLCCGPCAAAAGCSRRAVVNARSIADHGRSSGQSLLVCHDRLGGSNSPKSHPHTWNPSVVDPQLPRNLEQGVIPRSGAGTLPVRALFCRAVSVQDSLGVTRVCPRLAHVVTDVQGSTSYMLRFRILDVPCRYGM